MARRNREVGFVKSCVLASVLFVGLALPAQAQDKKLNLSATTYIATDYMFRSVSNTNQNPEAAAEFDLTYGIFYAGMWGSNTAYGENIEIDYYAGITPTWQGISFDIGGIYYTYPGAFDPGAELDYFELKTGASYTFAEKFTVGVTNYWSPENTGETGNNDVLELSGEYAFGGKLFNFFSPSMSGLVGWQWGEASKGGLEKTDIPETQRPEDD